MAKKVLVIGSKGMLGQELVKIFKADKDFAVTAWDRDEIDITKKEEVEKKVSALAPNIILNSAAYNAVDVCEKDKKEFAKAKALNGDAPGFLAKTAKKLDAVFVHYSTDYVFSGMPDFPEPEGCAGSCGSCSLHEGFVPELGFREDDLPEPIQKYGKTKFLGEKNVQKFGDRYYIIRLSKLFGKPAKAENAKKSFFDVMLEVGKKAQKMQNEVHPVKSSQKRGAQQGEQFDGVKVVDEEMSCFTYAPDLAKKTKEIIESEKAYGIYHVSNSGACTWYEAVIELYRQAKLKVKVVAVDSDAFPRPAKRPYVSTLVNTKLNPLRSYKLALREYLKNKK